MIKRFDHAVIGARDLDRALGVYRDYLGFDARPGGRHTGRGTHNGIVRFGLDYLELLAIYDQSEISGPAGAAMTDFLAQQEGGLIGFCLATDAIDHVAEAVRQAGLEPFGPFAMDRARPDGRVLRWRLVIPNGVAWRRPWPFFIQWENPDEERLAWEQPGDHPLGATGVAGVAVLVRDLNQMGDLYEQHLGLTLKEEDDDIDLGARRARFELGSLTIDLLEPAAEGPAQAELDRLGEGPYQVTLRVQDLAESRSRLERSGIRLEPAPGIPGGLLVPPESALGARLVLVAGS